jgi:putative ABC transport system substrate-binding protein
MRVIRLAVALTLSLVFAPLAAGAQAPEKLARVAFVNTTSPVSEMAGPEPSHPPTRDLLRALGAVGWVEGRNLIFERRSAEGRFERFGDILRELAGLPCDVIVTTGGPMTEEALRVTRTIPIVVTAVVPKTRRVAVLASPSFWNSAHGQALRAPRTA